MAKAQREFSIKDGGTLIESASRSRLPVLRFWDFGWLVLLGVFILAGVGMASFHGDEAMQITMSQDYVSAFTQLGSLAVHPPYEIDSPEWLRLINGSVNRYTIGLSWQVSGIGLSELPDIWQWPLSYEENVARGNRPSDAALLAARMPSAIFLALSAAVMFGIGWQLGGRWLAYVASGLYALNPVILLNGRRAMQEGSFLFFGLLAVWFAILISKQNENFRSERGMPRPAQAWLWVGFILASGFTLASKHSGVVFVAGAFGWVGVSALLGVIRSREWLPFAKHIIFPLLLSGALVIVVFVALSPALWNDPIARLGDLIVERQKLLDSQVVAEPAAPTSIGQRIEGILTQPFIAPPVHYEAAFWANAAPIQDEIARYMASPLSGLQAGMWLGLALTLLAALGVVQVVLGRIASWGQSYGLLAWLLVTIASLLVNPLPWQRYYLPLYPLAALLAGIGLLTIIRFVQKRLQPKSPLVVT